MCWCVMLVCNVCFGINEKEFIRFAVYHPELSQLDRRSVTDRLCNCFGSFEALQVMMLTAGRALADADGDGNLTQGNLTQGTRALSDHEERSPSEAAVVGIVAACSTVVALALLAAYHRFTRLQCNGLSNTVLQLEDPARSERQHDQNAGTELQPPPPPPPHLASNHQHQPAFSRQTHRSMAAVAARSPRAAATAACSIVPASPPNDSRLASPPFMPIAALASSQPSQ